MIRASCCVRCSIGATSLDRDRTTLQPAPVLAAGVFFPPRRHVYCNGHALSTMVYIPPMFTVLRTDEFKEWVAGLRDLKARARIDARIRRAEMGNLGDVKPVGDGVSEMRIDYGPGYRLYFTRRGLELIVLLCGGDKSTQTADIKRARKIAMEV